MASSDWDESNWSLRPACLRDANAADDPVQAPANMAQMQDRVNIDEYLREQKPPCNVPHAA
jgi:hypothetical protein